MHRISEALDDSYIIKVISLEILKTFDKVNHKELLPKLSNYNISGRVDATMKLFLSGRSIKVIVNGQFSDAHVVNASNRQGSLLDPYGTLLKRKMFGA